MWMDRLLHLRLEKSSAKIHLSCILKKAFADIDRSISDDQSAVRTA